MNGEERTITWIEALTPAPQRRFPLVTDYGREDVLIRLGQAPPADIE